MQNSDLGLLTGVMGDVLGALRDKGYALDDRGFLLFLDKCVAKFKALPDLGADARDKAIEMAAAVRDDSRIHGGLVTPSSMKLADTIMRELGSKKKGPRK